MSNYWGFVCLSHDPPIWDERVLNHGEDTLRAMWQRAQDEGVWPDAPTTPGVDDLIGAGPLAVEHRGILWTGPGAFLQGHQDCKIGIHDQRGAQVRLGAHTRALLRLEKREGGEWIPRSEWAGAEHAAHLLRRAETEWPGDVWRLNAQVKDEEDGW